MAVKGPIKWNKEKCIKEAQKYNSRVEMMKGNLGAYKAAKRYGWLDELFGDTVYKPAGWWNVKEHCLEEAKKYSTKMQFHDGSQTAYHYTCKNGWLSECGFNESETRSRAYKGKNLKWTKEKCYEAALQCSCRSEFHKRFRSAYRNAFKNGWINEYTWFKTPQPEDPMKKIYVIYAYEDRNNKVAYIGLANDMEKRHRGHKNGKKYHGVRRYDEIAKYCQSMGIELMKPKIKMADLNGVDAQNYENWYKKAYMNEGWKVLNIAPTGEGISSLGGTYRKYSDEEIIAAANKYDTPKEFMEAERNMYRAMYRHGLHKQIEWRGDFHAESRKRMTGNIPWNKGKKNCYSEEAIKRFCASAKKRANTPEGKKALRDAHEKYIQTTRTA